MPDTAAADPAWYTNETVRTMWKNGPATPDEMNTYLDAARVQCEAFAPALAEGAKMPPTWPLAQLKQAQALYNAGQDSQREPGSMFGGDSQVRVPRMDFGVMALLRPQRGTPGLG